MNGTQKESLIQIRTSHILMEQDNYTPIMARKQAIRELREEGAI